MASRSFGVSKDGIARWQSDVNRLQLNQKANWNNDEVRNKIANNISKFAKAKTPQPTWLFKTEFYFDEDSPVIVANETIFNKIKDCNGQVELQPISCSLPTEEVHTAEQFFLGTKKTVTIYRDRSGECTMEFYYRNPSTDSNGDKVNYSFFFLIAGAGGVYQGGMPKKKHTELGAPPIRSIHILLLNPDASSNTKYVLFNPVITNIEHASEMSYESEDVLKWTMTIHYDDWEVYTG